MNDLTYTDTDRLTPRTQPPAMCGIRTYEIRSDKKKAPTRIGSGDLLGHIVNN